MNRYTNFPEKVERTLGRLLDDHRFKIKTTRILDSGSISWIIYVSPSCLISFCRDMRDGSIACTLALPDAALDPINGPGWFSLSRLLLAGKSLTFEDVVARIPRSVRSDEEQLRDLDRTLSLHIDQAISNLQSGKTEVELLGV